MPLLSLLAASSALTAPAVPAEPVEPADVITVRGVFQPVEAEVAVDAEEIERLQATTLDELFRQTPGLEALAGPGRQFFDFNLRGSEGAGAVVVSVDGAEKNSVRTMHGVAVNPAFLVTEFLKRVTVVRGPQANTLGTGSIGGRIQFETVDPSDFLDSQRAGGRLVSGYETNGTGDFATGLAAARLSDSVAVLGGLSRREFERYEDGNDDEVINSGSTIFGALAKLQFTPNDDLEAELTYQRAEIDYIGANVFGRANFRQDADFRNSVTDDTLSLQASYAPEDLSWFELHGDAFFSRTDHEEETLAIRRGSRSELGELGIRETDSFGGKLYTLAEMPTGPVDHEIAFGVSGAFDTLAYSENQRDNGGDRSVYGAFLQDTVEISDQLSVIGGLRYELFDVETEQGVASDGGELLPKVTAIVSPFGKGSVDLVASYARGLRAPTLNNLTVDAVSEQTRRGRRRVNVDLGNENIEAEIADNYEAGLRYFGEAGPGELNLSVNVYRNEIDNRIENVVLSRVEEGNTVTITSQLQNVGQAILEGYEIRADYDLDRVFLRTSYQNMDGEREDTGRRLNSVRPWTGTAILGARGFGGRFEAGVEYEAFGDQIEIGDGDGVVGDSTEGAEVWNLYAAAAVTERLRINARVNNLTDNLYRRFDTIDNAIGLNAKISANYTF